MNDCPNADMRDLLPDLVSDRLDAPTRAAVEAHVAACADCRAEAALLRDVRASLRRTPALDMSAIVAAIPAYRAPARRSWVGWRTAAAITVLVVGGSSVAVLQRTPSVPDTLAIATVPVESLPATDPAVADVPAVDVPAVVGSEPPAQPAPPPARAAVSEGRELAMGGGSLTDLSDRELDALLRDIESLDALPTTDIESTSITPIAPSARGRGAP